MFSPSENLHRWLGMACLALAAGMVFWGRTVLLHSLAGGPFQVYWALCLGFAAAATTFGVLDIRQIRRKRRQFREELIRETLEAIRQGRPGRLDEEQNSND